MIKSSEVYTAAPGDIAVQRERDRVEELCFFEKKYAEAPYICGIDEVGRGPLAGPVVTAAVILPKDCRILYINDSKKLTEKRREALFEQIVSTAVSYGIGIVSHDIIDEVNILQATYRAMREAVADMKVRPDI